MPAMTDTYSMNPLELVTEYDHATGQFAFAIERRNWILAGYWAEEAQRLHFLLTYGGA